MMTLLYTSDPERGRTWRDVFAAEAADIGFVDPTDPHDPATIRYLAAWNPSVELIATLPALEILFSIGAGIDQFDMSRLPPHVRVVRMIEPGIAQGMVEHATMAVLAKKRILTPRCYHSTSLRRGCGGGVRSTKRWTKSNFPKSRTTRIS